MIEEKTNPAACERADDLIGFLYGELSDDQAQNFERHMHGCGLCSAELAAFSGVRRAVVAWRDESLGGIAFPAAAPYAAFASVSQEKPSALTALRQFFNLSPLWMKGAVAFATVLFCVFAGLAVASLRPTATAPVAQNTDKPGTPDSKKYSEEQLNAIIEQRVQEERQRLGNSAPSTQPQLVVENQSKKVPSRRSATRGSALATNSPTRRPLSKAEREQLAADLRLVNLSHDGELELLDDTINQ